MDFIIKIRWNCGTERYVTGVSESFQDGFSDCITQSEKEVK